MRYVKFIVGDAFKPDLLVTNDEANYTPLNIEFEIQSFLAGGINNGIAFVKVYIQGADMYKDLLKLKGKSCTLYAGAKKTPLSTALGYKHTSTSQVLYKGKIGGILGNYSIINPFVYFGFEPLSNNSNSIQCKFKAGDKIFVEKAAGTAFSHLKAVEATDLITCFKTFFDKSVTIKVEADLQNVTYKGKQNETHTFKAHSEVMAVMEAYGAYGYFDAQENTFYFVKASKERDSEKWLTENAARLYRLKSGGTLKTGNSAVDYVNKITNAVKQSPLQIDYNQIINQPINMGFSGQVNLTTFLNPEISLGRELQLGRITSSIANSIVTNNFVNTQSDKLKLIKEGKFIATKVIHKGNFYGTSSDQWATTIEMLPTSLAQTYNLG